jgi:hypothetical protein
MCCVFLADPLAAQQRKPVALSRQEQTTPAIGRDKHVQGDFLSPKAELRQPRSGKDGANLPLIGALVGGVVLGALAVQECRDIGCTTIISVPIAAGIGAGAGALTGWIIQRLRTPTTRSEPLGI